MDTGFGAKYGNKKKPQVFELAAFKVAGWTRLELATSCVTGRRSNQLNYHPFDYSSIKAFFLFLVNSFFLFFFFFRAFFSGGGLFLFFISLLYF